MLLRSARTGHHEAGFTPGYGTDTLKSFYRQAIATDPGGQELGAQAIFSRRGDGAAPRR